MPILKTHFEFLRNRRPTCRLTVEQIQTYGNESLECFPHSQSVEHLTSKFTSKEAGLQNVETRNTLQLTNYNRYTG